MFGISFSELLVVMVVLLLFVGPDDMPKVARTLGSWAAKARYHSDALRREFYNAVYPPFPEPPSGTSARPLGTTSNDPTPSSGSTGSPGSTELSGPTGSGLPGSPDTHGSAEAQNLNPSLIPAVAPMDPSGTDPRAGVGPRHGRDMRPFRPGLEPMGATFGSFVPNNTAPNSAAPNSAAQGDGPKEGSEAALAGGAVEIPGARPQAPYLSEDVGQTKPEESRPETPAEEDPVKI